MQLAPCPENATFEAMLNGHVAEELRSHVLLHAESCDACADTLVALFDTPARSNEGDLAFATTVAGTDRRRAEPTILPSGFQVTSQLTIREVVGSGGMGTVYRAFHEGLGCDVAVKVLRYAERRDDAETRLKREARVLAQLPTEHVVRIFDVGALANGDTYLVMELLAGETMRAHLQSRGTLSPREAVELATKICRAIASAHAKGIVHRDLKPENVFVLPDGTVKILDFGLSKLAPAINVDMSITHSGTFLGTPLYVAPEQVKEAQHVDARADVWALGVILYEMLAGETPFRRKSVGATLAAVLTEVPPKLDVPPELAVLVSHCLSVTVDSRPKDAEDLAERLQQIKLGVSHTPDTSRARRIAIRNLAVLLGTGILALGLPWIFTSAGLPNQGSRRALPVPTAILSEVVAETTPASAATDGAIPRPITTTIPSSIHSGKPVYSLSSSTFPLRSAVASASRQVPTIVKASPYP